MVDHELPAAEARSRCTPTALSHMHGPLAHRAAPHCALPEERKWVALSTVLLLSSPLRPYNDSCTPLTLCFLKSSQPAEKQQRERPQSHTGARPNVALKLPPWVIQVTRQPRKKEPPLVPTHHRTPIRLRCQHMVRLAVADVVLLPLQDNGPATTREIKSEVRCPIILSLLPSLPSSLWTHREQCAEWCVRSDFPRSSAAVHGDEDQGAGGQDV